MRKEPYKHRYPSEGMMKILCETSGSTYIYQRDMMNI